MTFEVAEHELENGARASTPAGDNLLLDFTRTDGAAFAALAAAAGGRVEHDQALGITMTDAASPCPFGNIAHFGRPLSSDEAIAVVATLEAFYSARAGGPYIAFSAWPTPDLSAHGFTLGGHPPLMARPAGPRPADPSHGALRVVEVADPAQLDEFEHTLAEAYPAAELLPYGSQQRLFADAVLDSNWRLFIGYDGDTAVATAGAFVTDTLVGIELVSTRPECRGRGFGGAITAAAVGVACDRPTALVSSDSGRNVYAQLGFLPLLRYTLWIGTR